MSVESSFKNYIDLDLPINKQLQQTISQRDADSRVRLSSKTSMKDRHRNPPPKSRSRTISAAAAPDNTVTNVNDLLLKPIKVEEKNERRYSDLKSTFEQQDQSNLERHSSIPQIPFAVLIPQGLRSAKFHQRANSKDETNLIQITVNHVNASANHLVNTSTTKIDPPFALKSPTLPMRSTRLVSTVSNGSSILSHNDDVLASSSFTLEEYSPEPRSVELTIVESRAPICVSEIYHEHFYEHFHTNYYGEYDEEGPFIASVRCSYQKTSLGEVCEARAIIRTPYRNCDVSDIVTGSNENNILQMLFNKSHLPPIRSYGAIGDPKANEKIYLFDKTNDERYSCKIGVIYQKVHQTDEYEIFSNDSAPADMFNFLNILAERVRLKGFTKYRGDLDTKGDLHGEYSYYTGYRNHEIMFNVAPLVPSLKANGQCIERKGLVGNAFVCIVFQDPGAVFLPDYISGKVTQIYITVQPVVLEDGLYYKVGIWRRNDITVAVDPSGGVFKYDRSFVSYFLTLLLNAVNVAVESPSLRARVYEQRLRVKFEELKKLSYQFSLGPIPDFTSDTDNSQNQTEVRRENSASSSTNTSLVTATSSSSSAATTVSATTTTTTTTDSLSANAGRTSPTPSRRRGFSKKLFGVFSSRSGSMSSALPPSTPPTNNDLTPSSPQSSSTRDMVRSISRPNHRPNNNTNNEGLTRKRSLKSNAAPTIACRSSNSEVSSSMSAQMPTSSASSSSLLLLNPFLYNSNNKQTNMINHAALAITPRNRSNSSPEQVIINTNKSISNTGSKATEDESTTTSSTSEETDSEEESSEEETLPTRPFNFA